MSFLAGTLSQFWLRVQGTLFPWLAAELGELSGKQKQLVKILELVQIEHFLKGPQSGGWDDRSKIGRRLRARLWPKRSTTWRRRDNCLSG